MTGPPGGLAVLWAAAPIVLILALMLGPGWSAARAGLAALALAVPLAYAVFGFGAAAPAAAFGGVAAEAAFLAATILWILWPALALHALQQAGGAIDTLRAALARLTQRPALQALLVGWFVALFLEGAAGFGTPIALAAPLLVGLGLPPLQAVVLALLGHAAGVSFGALGTPVLAQVGLTGLEAGAIAWRTALLHAMLGPLLMLFFVRTLAASGLAPGLGWPALAAAAFLLPAFALAALLGPELPTLGAALLGGALFAWALRRHAPAAPGVPTAPVPGVLRALAPYALLVALVLLTRAVPPLAEALGSLHWRWGLGQDGSGGARFGGQLQPLTHPGTLLFVALVGGALWQRVPLHELRPALAGSARRLLPVSVALLAMLALARLMLHAGMVDALQQAAVQGLGQAWPLLAPALGALGSFVTGSATASNVLFTTLQVQTAEALALPAAALAAAQGFGAAVGNIVCPHNIVAGAATVGLAGREAQVLRHTLVPCLLYLAAGGVLLTLLLAGPWAA